MNKIFCAYDYNQQSLYWYSAETGEKITNQQALEILGLEYYTDKVFALGHEAGQNY